MTRLGSDDLQFLNAVRALAARGMGESEIAVQLGIEEGELRERMARIRSAFVSLTGVVGLATGERATDVNELWEVVIDEGPCVPA